MINNNFGLTYSQKNLINSSTQSSFENYIAVKKQQNPSFAYVTYSTDMVVSNNKFAQKANLGTQSNSHPFSAAIQKQKKFYVTPNANTKKLAAEPLSNLISTMTNTDIKKAENLITKANVTVNGNLVTDTAYQLKSGDVVRVGIGHILNNSKFMVVIQ